MESKKKRSLRSRVEDYFVLGSDFRRAAYSALMRLRTDGVGRRRRLAGRAAPNGDDCIRPEKGFRVLCPGAFAEVDEIISEVEASLEGRHRARLGSNRKRQLATGLLDRERLTRDSPFLRFALNPRLLAVVCGYLEVVPILSNVDIWHSTYSGEEYHDSQLYHCDWNDRKLVKVFVYCTRVEPENGPLVVLDAGVSRRVRKQLRYTYGSRGGRVDDQRMYAIVPESSKTPLVGPAGSVALVDTSRCFHYGSRLGPGASPRVVVMLRYTTPLAFDLPRKRLDVRPFRSLARSEDPELVRLVLGAS